MRQFLSALSQAATSPYAFIAYLAVISAWVYVTINQRRLTHDLHLVARLRQEDRLRYIEQRYKAEPRAGLSAEQYLRGRRLSFLFMGYIFTIAAGVVVIVLSLTLYRPGADGGQTITPLKNPELILPRGPRSWLPSLIGPARASDGSSPRLRLRAVMVSEESPGKKLFDIILSNTSKEQVILTTLKARWLYLSGHLASIQTAVSLRPTEKYHIDLKIHRHQSGTLLGADVAMSPMVVIPPAAESGPGIFSFRLEVVYSFPAGDSFSRSSGTHAFQWDLLYDISIVDEYNQQTELVSRSWNNGEKLGWLKDYCSQKRPDSNLMSDMPSPSDRSSEYRYTREALALCRGAPPVKPAEERESSGFREM